MALQCGRPLAVLQQHLPDTCRLRSRVGVLVPCSRFRSIGRKCSIQASPRRGCRMRCVMVLDSPLSDSQAQDEEEQYQDDDSVSEEDSLSEDDEDTVDADLLSNEEIDALMKEYGNVVLSDPEPRKPSDDAETDAESLSMALAMAKIANEVKAVDIKVLHVKPLIYWTRYFVVATAFSIPQANAIVGRMKDLAEEQFKTFAKGNPKPSAWTLLDFGDVVVHLFLPADREFYNLEEFYANAPVVELPFASETSGNRVP